MKKLFLVIIFLYYCILLLDGQKWNWSNHLVCDGAVNVYSVAVDNNNNTYLAGTYSNSTLSVGTDTINNFGDQDGFVCKFDPNGTLQWLKRIGGSGRDIAVKLVIANNNLYVAGDFRSTILYFTPADFLANTNNFDAFLCSYDLNGNFLNATRIFYGSDIDRIKDMVFDQAENSLIISGQFKNEIKYYDGTSEIIVPAKSAINKDLLVVKSNLAGEIQDTAFYEITVANSMIKDVNLCQSEGYFLSGDLLGTLYFTGSDSIVGNTTYNSDAMVFKIDKNLNFQWARKGGGTGYDHGNSAISDKYGNIYITGKAESYIVFDSTATLGSHTLSSFGAQDLFLAKYNKLGTLQYIKVWRSNPLKKPLQR